MKIRVLGLILILFNSSVLGQTPDQKYLQDVQSIEAIMDAYYDVVSGSADDPWQFERDKFLHSPAALIVKIDQNGNSEARSLEAEYIPLLLTKKQDLYEIELKRKVSIFGNLAQVWSAFEVRSNPEDPTDIKGLTSLQLHYENG